MSAIAREVRSNTGMPSARLAMWVLLSGEIVIFGGVLVSYILLRLANPQWGEDAHHTQTFIGAFNALVLLTSDLFVVMAHAAAQKGDKDNAYKYVNLTILMGVLFLCVKAYEYSSEISHGFTMFASNFWSFYYLTTGLHGAHIVVGALALFIVNMGVKKGENLGRVEIAGIYWHFVDMVWLIVFPLFYIAK